MRSLAPELLDLLAGESPDLARIALLIGRIECPGATPSSSLSFIDHLGSVVDRRLSDLRHTTVRGRIAEINRVLYDDEGFRGNRSHYEDLRNSLLHLVIERRLGIPISLAVLYISVARRAGLEVFGVAFPGHFLLRVPGDAGDDSGRPLILDPFDRGRELDEHALHALFSKYGGDDAPWSDRLLLPCTTRQIAVRMISNLKRLYVSLRSFSQAWMATDLLVAIGGPDPEDVRDRGLLAYHLDDFPSALRDIEEYLRSADDQREGRDERAQIRDHLGALRRRVASMN